MGTTLYPGRLQTAAKFPGFGPADSPEKSAANCFQRRVGAGVSTLPQPSGAPFVLLEGFDGQVAVAPCGFLNLFDRPSKQQSTARAASCRQTNIALGDIWNMLGAG
jgi:hypothetical protein